MGQIITPEKFKQMQQAEQDLMIIDVRRVNDYKEGCISGAMNIPQTAIEDHLDQLPRDKKIILYCYRGNSSKRVMELLINNGFEDVYSLEGGYTQFNSTT